MSYLEELLPEFKKGAKIRRKDWKKEQYLSFECNDIWTEDDELVSFRGEDFVYDSWEFYQEPIDWNYIIKNKCLCWFWDEGEEEETKVAGLLADYDSSEAIFSRYRGKNTVTRYDYCCPVRRDEVTFYEDRKDE